MIDGSAAFERRFRMAATASILWALAAWAFAGVVVVGSLAVFAVLSLG